jgi:hypothetical protein
MVRGSAFALFAAALFTGTIADRAIPVRGDGILSADLHVHGGLPLDATLPPWEIQKEARRRGLDAIAMVGHNHPLAAWYERLMSDDVVVLPGLEVLSANRHLVAAGVRGWIDWRLPADAAIEAIHRQGGVAIAAHPVRVSWVTRNARALTLLDGAEVAHPVIDFEPDGAQEMLEFYQGARTGNPSIAPIGSSDNHGLNDMGIWRTYLIGAERSERGVLEAIRAGRTVADDGRGNLTGSPEHVAAVRAHLASRPPATPGSLQRWSAVTALLALAVAMIFR